MDNEEDIKQKQELVKIHKRRLHLLEKRVAMQGITVDPSVIMEIDDIRTVIQLLETEIKELETVTRKDKMSEDISTDIIDILGVATASQDYALVLLAQRIEQRLIPMLRPDLSQSQTTRVVSPIRIVEDAVQKGIFQPDFLDSFRHFWSMRNRIAHGGDAEVTLRELYIGARILQTIASKK